MNSIQRTVTQLIVPTELNRTIAFWNDHGYRLIGTLPPLPTGEVCATFAKVDTVYQESARQLGTQDWTLETYD